MGDVICFPAAYEQQSEGWPEALKPHTLASLEEVCTSLEILAADGYLDARVRVETADDGSWVCCIPSMPALRGRVLAALRAYIAARLTTGLIITTSTVADFDTWTLAPGACRGSRQGYGFAPYFGTTGEPQSLTIEDAPLLITSFGLWFCKSNRTEKMNAVDAALISSVFGPGGMWQIVQIKPPPSVSLEALS